MNHRGSSRLTIGIGLTVLCLSACGAPATTPPTATPTSLPPTATPTPVPPPAAAVTFPIGTFDCKDCTPNLEGFITRYLEDGTLVVWEWGREELTGKWYTEGDIFYEGDTWCHDVETMPAAYKWQFDGALLTFERIEDECWDRIDSLDGLTYRLIEPLPMGTYSAKGGDYVLELGEDRSFTFSEKDGEYNTSGTFSTDENTITWETDRYCDQESLGKVTYTWTFQKDALIFKVVGKDPCGARKGFLLFAYAKNDDN